MGVNTRQSFESVLSLALGSAETPAAVVLTGDLVHDGSPEGYAYLADILADTGLPCHYIPGNHDRLDLMETRLGPAAITHLALRRLGDWSLVLLDSNVPGEEGGHLERRQLGRVEGILAEAQGPCLIFVHQQPLAIESRWMDAMAIDNGGELLELCARHPQAKGVVFGHVHQEFDALYGPVRVLGCPSTCVQFLPRSDTFAMDSCTPGFRELLLHPDGLLETSVIRLAAYPEPLQLHTEGY
jgi:Icc protein